VGESLRLIIELDQVLAAKEGDRASLEKLLEAVWPHAFRIAQSILRNETAAEDAAQEACVAVFRTISTLRSPDAFPAWFYRLVVRQAMSDYKQLPAPVPNPATIGDPTDSHALGIDVRAALDALPLGQRTTLILFHYAGLTSKEIGAVMGVPPPTVRFRLAQARRSMRKLLDRGDYTRSTREALS